MIEAGLTAGVVGAWASGGPVGPPWWVALVLVVVVASAW